MIYGLILALKANIIFEQLLEISPIARKTLEERMSVTRRTKKVKTRVAIKVQLQGGRRDVKAIEIRVMVVHKVVPNVLVDGGSRLNMLLEHIMNRLGLSLMDPSPFIINMAYQTLAVPLGMIKNCKINTGEKICGYFSYHQDAL